MAERISSSVGQISFKINVRAILVLSKRLRAQVDIHGAGEREGDDERRGHQKIGADVLVHAGLKVAVAGEDAGSNEIILRDRFLERGMQRAGVSDAGRAAVADGLKAELVEVGLKTGLLQVVGDHTRAGTEGGLDGWIHFQSPFDSFLGEQRRAEHDTWDCSYSCSL